MENKFGCTIPGINSQNNLSVCASNGTASEVGVLDITASKIIFQATKEHFEVLGRQDGKCMQPCENTIVYFGFPFFASTDKQRGYVKIYLKRMVKEIEDHQDYTMLR